MMEPPKHYARPNGEFIATYYGGEPDEPCVEIPECPPLDGKQIWLFPGWEPVPVSVQDFVHAIQSKLDASAKSFGYDDIRAAVTYADEPAVPKFQGEGQAFRAWRSLVWAYAYEQLAEVTDGHRSPPTVEHLLDELPLLVMPTAN